MTPRKTSALLAPCVTALLLVGCWGGDESGPDDAMKPYSPAYTEAVGTVHAGDYFPLVEGDVIGITGTMTGSQVMSARGVIDGEKVAEDSTTPMSETVSGMVTTQAPRSMTFSQGSFTVFPQVTTTFSPGGVLTESESSTDYFEKAEDAIYLRGVSADDGSVAEPSNPLYFKLPFRVGDTWESATDDAPEVSEDGIEMDVTMRPRTYVIGMENTVVAGRTVQALRLDQVIEISGTAFEPDLSMNMTLSGEIRFVLHLEEGKGQVQQTMSSKMTVSGTATQGADQITVKTVTTLRAEVERVDGPVAAIATIAKAPAKAAAPASAPGHEARARAAALTVVKAALRNRGAAFRH